MSYRNNDNFVKAIRFIYNNIDQPIKLENIANAVGISLSSLKRLFVDATNKMPGEFIRRLRMELAFHSLQSRSDNILQVALNAGFDDQSAFARCFKATFGYTPRAARKKLNIVNELESVILDEPDIVELTELPIQSITATGLYFESAKIAWDSLKARLSHHKCDEDFSELFIGIGHDNPHDKEVAEDEVRFSAGVALLEQDLEIDHRIIPGGTYARFHYTGKPVNLGLAYHYIYGKWSALSEYKINNSMSAFIVFENFPEALREEKLLIHVPIMHKCNA